MQHEGGEPVASAEVFGEARSYTELIGIFRHRVAALGCTCETVDAVAGLPLRYTAKLLSPRMVRSVGRASLGPLLATLGLRLFVAADTSGDFEQRIRPRLTLSRHAGGRLLASVKHGRRRLSGKEASEYFRLLRAKQLVLQQPRVRRRIAKIAARARWRNGASRRSEAPPVR